MALARGGLLDASGVAAAPAESLAVFSDAIPEFADRFTVARREPGRVSYARALSDVLRAALDEQPIVLAVDDAQWLDQASCWRCSLPCETSRPLHSFCCSPAICPPLGPSWTRSAASWGGKSGVKCSGWLLLVWLSSMRSLHMLPQFDAAEIERVVRRVSTDSQEQGMPLLAVELLRAVALGLDLRGMAGAWPEPLKTLEQTLPGGAAGHNRCRYSGEFPPAQSTRAAGAQCCSCVGRQSVLPRWRHTFSASGMLKPRLRSTSWSGSGGSSATLAATPLSPGWSARWWLGTC